MSASAVAVMDVVVYGHIINTVTILGRVFWCLSPSHFITLLFNLLIFSKLHKNNHKSAFSSQTDQQIAL